MSAKPPKSSWMVDEKVGHKIESMLLMHICQDDDLKKIPGTILKAIGLAKTASSAVNLLIDIGYFPILSPAMSWRIEFCQPDIASRAFCFFCGLWSRCD
ncbi:hypothetical protein QYF36_000116 [Acer negundo]|nr:hypothetical protein QYF36_000116 [Acer negundo]